MISKIKEKEDTITYPCLMVSNFGTIFVVPNNSNTAKCCAVGHDDNYNKKSSLVAKPVGLGRVLDKDTLEGLELYPHAIELHNQ